MGLWSQTTNSLYKWHNACIWVLIVVLIMVFCPTSTVARIFTQEAKRYCTSGLAQDCIVIEPDSLHNLSTWSFDLGQGRKLDIQTNLPQTRYGEIDLLASVIQRCYYFLDTNTGRTVPGGVLLYLIHYPQRPRCYRFQVEVPDSESWAQIRIALLDSDQPLLGAGSSPHVTEFLFDTLPHELTHSLLECVPTVRHDLDGETSQGTRWFIEGICEKMAKDFSLEESPVFHRKALARRNLDSILWREDLCSMVWQWGQSSTFPWSDESNLYGLSMLLVTAWSEQIELSDLIALMSSRGGRYNGDALIELLMETTGFDKSSILQRAKMFARQRPVSSPLSLLQTQ